MAKCNKLAWTQAHLCVCLLAATAIAGCTGATQSSSPSNANTPPSASGVTAKVTPSSATVRAGATQSLSAAITGSSNTAVTWQVNGVAGGNTATGTISASGLYTAPNSVPNPNMVTVRAVSSADATVSGSSTLTLQNPVPVLAGLAPTSVPAGAFAIAVNGSGFVSGAQVLLAGAPLATTFVSATQLRAGGNEAGMIRADNGSSMYISGAPDARWDNNDLHNLGSVTASDFEVAQMNPIFTAANIPAGPTPTISSFTASSQNVSAGTPVTLSWNVAGAS